MIYSITYVSKAKAAFGAQALKDLLAICVTHNARLGITGMLLYKDGWFMQVLEGRTVAVHVIYTRIERDSRHHELKVIVREPTLERSFTDWSMGFQDLDCTDLVAYPGYSEFLDIPLTHDVFSADAARRRRLLALFKKRF